MKTLSIIAAMFACATSMAQDYDEYLVPAYTLPDPLVSNNGAQAGNSKAWTAARRPEIRQLFENNVYGVMPKDYDSIRYETLREDFANYHFYRK